MFIQKHYDVDSGFYLKRFTSELENVLMCFMKQIVIAVKKIQPKGALVHVLGGLIKKKYLPNRFRAEACQVCIRFLLEIFFIETLLLTNLGNLAGMSLTEIEILVSTRSENCSISDTKVCQQLCPTFQYLLNYFINY